MYGASDVCAGTPWLGNMAAHCAGGAPLGNASTRLTPYSATSSNTNPLESILISTVVQIAEITCLYFAIYSPISVFLLYLLIYLKLQSYMTTYIPSRRAALTSYVIYGLGLKWHRQNNVSVMYFALHSCVKSNQWSTPWGRGRGRASSRLTQSVCLLMYALSELIRDLRADRQRHYMYTRASSVVCT